ncbi:MAG: YvcK family protein [Candidatus Levybacteria bacterium]|nr:YvcK family protein [Candidatus Levybacteria bacterium]
MVSKKVVCLGGGIGTANLLAGIKNKFTDVTAIVSMADDGGSAGRLRRYYKTFPPGDVINCMIALSQKNELMKDLLRFRFSGNRYGPDNILPGQKLGNLILVALTTIKGDFSKGLFEMQKIFNTKGRIFPSTAVPISIWAKTSTGHIVTREENIDRGIFKGQIKKLFIKPKNPPVLGAVLEELKKADVIIAGPGDLYTTILPVIMVPQIRNEIEKSKAQKIFVVNVANKRYETPKYFLSDFANAIEKHCHNIMFDMFILNNNFSFEIPQKHQKDYKYVPIDEQLGNNPYKVTYGDLVNRDFPLYHDSLKLANTIVSNI